MNQVELLRHVADNLEAGRDAGHGLMLCNQPCIARSAGAICYSQPHDYSLAPRTRIINGIEVPAPMDKEPENGQPYWYESPPIDRLCAWNKWRGDPIDRLRFARGLCYLTEESAAANCKARYGIE